jgi:regulator of protease activity HflC (stomatin/prohibitin superfamily)
MKSLVRLLGLFSLLVMVSSCNRIDAGHEGIRVDLYGSDKGVQDIALVTGMAFYNPFTETIYEFPTFIQTADYPAFTINSKDGSVFTVDPTISFSVTTGKTPYIFKKYRKTLDEITNTALLNYTKDAFRLGMNRYTTDELISKRTMFESDVQNTLDSVFLKEGFRLEQMTSGLTYPQVIVEAINNKNKAVQDAQRAENELKVAEANAKVKFVQAEAEAKANQIKSSTLNELLIKQKFIDKWDGSSPLYGNAPTFIKNLP